MYKCVIYNEYSHTLYTRLGTQMLALMCNKHTILHKSRHMNSLVQVNLQSLCCWTSAWWWAFRLLSVSPFSTPNIKVIKLLFIRVLSRCSYWQSTSRTICNLLFHLKTFELVIRDLRMTKTLLVMVLFLKLERNKMRRDIRILLRVKSRDLIVIIYLQNTFVVLSLYPFILHDEDRAQIDISQFPKESKCKNGGQGSMILYWLSVIPAFGLRYDVAFY